MQAIFFACEGLTRIARYGILFMKKMPLSHSGFVSELTVLLEFERDLIKDFCKTRFFLILVCNLILCLPKMPKLFFMKKDIIFC